MLAFSSVIHAKSRSLQALGFSASPNHFPHKQHYSKLAMNEQKQENA